MTVFFFVLAFIFFCLFVFTVLQVHALEHLLEKQAARLTEALRLARHWQERAVDAERALTAWSPPPSPKEGEG